MSVSLEYANTKSTEQNISCNRELEVNDILKKDISSNRTIENGIITQTNSVNGLEEAPCEEENTMGIDSDDSTRVLKRKAENLEETEPPCEGMPLSDDDVQETSENCENVPPFDDCNDAEVDKESRIRRQLNKLELLKEDLRCEESTLCLLRKLIESQRGKSAYSKKVSAVQPVVHHHKQHYLPNNNNNKMKQSPVQNAKPSMQKYFIQVGNQLVPAPPPGSSGSAPVYQYTNGTSSSSSYQKSLLPAKQTAEQKQNAAKAALRRQLEQTLLQIPPPRPPPAGWKAIPNVNSLDFMMLVGLDEVVDSLLDIDGKPTLKQALEGLMRYNPRICLQCKVDFSPCWKSKKEYVLCERCSMQNIKKDLKAEHTSRLKAAFLKALTQEQEIDEKIKAGEDVNLTNLTGAGEKNERMNSPTLHTAARVSSPDSRHHHRPQPQHKVVSHYPHHTSLVQQLHHIHDDQPPPPQQQRRWHPYMTSSNREHSHHRSYGPSTESGGSHQEYYVVHHPQHSSVRYMSR